ncbi:MarR family transcriptional regulator [Microbacterium sp. X-17]|uniref:MarR family winged helix-turn-helix transcriptional regulator n=1 Tax=Microbacterium sp. X-17 TaxID=3144404 RepID=UPI0031F585D0
MTESEGRRLAAVISPLRRILLRRSRATEHLPDLPDSHIEVLRALPRGTVLTASDLARRIDLRPSTLSNLLVAMESAGLVARRQDETDRRRVLILATPWALTLFERYDTASAALIETATHTLTEQHQRALSAAIPALEKLEVALRDQKPPSIDRNPE